MQKEMLGIIITRSSALMPRCRGHSCSGSRLNYETLSLKDTWILDDNDDNDDNTCSDHFQSRRQTELLVGSFISGFSGGVHRSPPHVD